MTTLARGTTFDELLKNGKIDEAQDVLYEMGQQNPAPGSIINVQGVGFVQVPTDYAAALANLIRFRVASGQDAPLTDGLLNIVAAPSGRVIGGRPIRSVGNEISRSVDLEERKDRIGAGKMISQGNRLLEAARDAPGYLESKQADLERITDEAAAFAQRVAQEKKDSKNLSIEKANELGDKAGKRRLKSLLSQHEANYPLSVVKFAQSKAKNLA